MKLIPLAENSLESLLACVCRILKEVNNGIGDKIIIFVMSASLFYSKLPALVDVIRSFW